MGQQYDTAVLTLDAAEVLERHRLVRENSDGDLVYADAGEMPIGPVGRRIASGDQAAVEIVRNKPGTIQVVTAGAYSRRARVYAAADGKVSTVNTGVLIGELLAASGGDGAIVECLPDLRRVPYVAAAASATIANTTTETAFDKSVTIPFSELVAGSVLRVKGTAKVLDQNSTDTLVLKLKCGTEIVLQTAALDVADNDEFYFEADIVIRTVGASGTLVAAVAHAFDAAGTAVAVGNKAEATEDMTSGLLISLTATWSVAHADNQVRLETLTVEHLR